MVSYLQFVVLLCVLALTSAEAWAQKKRLPIIDMHMHARTAHHYGPNPGPLCAPVEKMPTWDPAKPFGESLEKSEPPCKRPVQPAATDAEVMGQTIAVMKRHNIIGMLGGKPDLVAKWMAAAPGRFIPGLDFRLDRDGGTASAAGGSEGYQALTPQAIRELHRSGSLSVLGEVLNQYGGITPDDPRMEPYWALAEELDIPVGIHLGPGGPGEFYLGNKNYRARLQSALTMEEVLVRHPKMRVYLMHAGYPMLDDLLALLFSHPQVYVAVSMLANVEPRAGFYRYLKAIVDAGYGERVMFGSDQMVWPNIIEPAIDAIEGAPFLSPKQKRDIFYSNAARLLRLSPEKIARHHNM
ncbi:MAG: amidohydrolase [Acidobacteria bacterium]|nr:amidohydrolase [Acidobacteriota bacterium]